MVRQLIRVIIVLIILLIKQAFFPADKEEAFEDFQEESLTMEESKETGGRFSCLPFLNRSDVTDLSVE